MNKLILSLGIILSVVLFLGISTIAEEITLTTYYPAPYGVFDELTTRGNTCLATTSGNVGIGTTDPDEKLDLEDGNIGDVNTIKSKPGSQPLRLQAMGSLLLSADANNDDTTSTIKFYIDGEGAAYLKMIINTDGNVGIGTESPGSYKLNVKGDTFVTRIYTGAATQAHGQGHNFTDIAEYINVRTEDSLEPGDVVSIDTENDETVRRSTEDYDLALAGIISSEDSAAFIIGKENEISNKKLLALAGRVVVKATTINGPIKRGDLLTSSSVPGHAMKATKPGPIIGKALEGLESGTGKIKVLVNLGWYGR